MRRNAGNFRIVLLILPVSLTKTNTTMAKFNLQAVIDAAIAAGDVTVSNEAKFLNADGTPLKVRSMEGTSDPLEVGDTFTVPADYKVCLVEIGGTPRPFVHVTVKSKDGSERAFRLFPNSLCKTVTPIVDGVRQAKAKTSGTATKAYAATDTVDEGLQVLVGKPIQVTDYTTYAYQDWTTHEVKQTRIYQYDFA